MYKIFVFLFLFSIVNNSVNSQDLDQILNELNLDQTPDYAIATFKGTTIINGQSVEIPGKSDLHFVMSHRFGAVNQGIYDFFGLDQASARFGFEYGFKNIGSLSIGRNSFNKVYDGSVKLKLLKQQTGIKNIPITVAIYAGAFVNTLKWEIPERENLFSSRLSYATQVLIARKFNKSFSLQLTPSFIHKNLVQTPDDQNNIYSIGIGGRYKISRKISLNGEYFYLLPGETAKKYTNSLSFGMDIETGGHVFQLQFSNSQQMFAPGFITETTGQWDKGDIYFGFNLYRVFPLNRKLDKKN